MLDNEGEVTILLANGKTLYFDNVESCREVEEYDAGTFVIIHYSTRTRRKVVRFSLANENVVGYVVDKKLSRF